MDLSEYFDDKPNYDYWLLLDSWNIQQISCLFCGDDPNSTGYNLIGRVSHAIRAKQTEDDLFFLPKDVIKWAIKKSLDIPKELVDWYDQYKKQKNSKQVIEQLDIERENYRLIAIENESLKKQLETRLQSQAINSFELNDDSRPISDDLEKSYLKIIAVLLAVINGTAPPKNEKQNVSVKQHPSFTSQADLVTFIAENKTYNKARGLGKTSLDTKFANAKRTLDESLK